jgi:trans-2,3-dihydro-3-hydroxyanthranilate isomerase
MKKYEFMQVDVFARVPLEGNPCALLSANADFRVHYFTPREEIPLAGHPTIATVHSLVETGRIEFDNKPVSVTIELTAGIIRVDIEPAPEGFLVIMHQLKPKFMQTYPASEIMPLFSLREDDWLECAPIQTVSTGTPMLMLPLASLDALKRAELSVLEYLDYKSKSDFFSPHLFCLQGINNEGDTFARHFGVPPDTYEDAFTGSASGCMLAYLWHRQLIKKSKIVAQQGHWMQRPGQAVLEVVGAPDKIETIKLIGNAITVITGQLCI